MSEPADNSETTTRRRGHAVVTGGSSGIGFAVVQHLLSRGLHVTALDMREARSDPTPRGDAIWQQHQVDVTREREVYDALLSAAAKAGTPRHLVTSHGIRGEFKPALEMDLDTYRRVLDVHLVGTLVAARSLVKIMDERADASAPRQAASIVTISSTTAYGGWANQADYGVAKAAIGQLTRNLAIEWAPRIRVNSVAPGHTLTPMVQEMIETGYDVSATHARTPLGRMAAPEEMATAIEFLLLDATFATGVCLPVDGGWTTAGK